MKLSLSKSPILAVVVVAALAAGTVLVAGYAEKPNDAVKVAADSPCNGCPAQGAEACCQAQAGSCCGTKECASACEKSACEKPPAGCCQQTAPSASCGTLRCGDQAKSDGSKGACPFAQ